MNTVQWAPPSTVLAKPRGFPVSIPAVKSPNPAYIVLWVGSSGLKAIWEIASDGKSSVKGVQDGLALVPVVVTHTPPLTVATKILAGSAGSTAAALIAPDACT
jgi:hypothetical protein